MSDSNEYEDHEFSIIFDCESNQTENNDFKIKNVEEHIFEIISKKNNRIIEILTPNITNLINSHIQKKNKHEVEENISFINKYKKQLEQIYTLAFWSKDKLFTFFIFIIFLTIIIIFSTIQYNKYRDGKLNPSIHIEKIKMESIPWPSLIICNAEPNQKIILYGCYLGDDSFDCTNDILYFYDEYEQYCMSVIRNPLLVPFSHDNMLDNQFVLYLEIETNITTTKVFGIEIYMYENETLNPISMRNSYNLRHDVYAVFQIEKTIYQSINGSTSYTFDTDHGFSMLNENTEKYRNKILILFKYRTFIVTKLTEKEPSWLDMVGGIFGTASFLYAIFKFLKKRINNNN